MSVWTKFRDTAVRGVAAYYTGGASEAYFQARDAQRGARDAAGINAMPTQTFLAPAVVPSAGPGGVVKNEPGAWPVRNYQVRGSQPLRAAMSSAAAYARKYPTWVGTLPQGMGTVAQMILNGQLPPIKRRRRRGISASDLSKFRRVASFLHKWAPIARHTPTRARAARR